MANPRQPIELILAKGRKNLTKAEIEERKSQEIKAPADKVRAPKYLTKEQRREFNKISKQLLEIGIMTNLDCDALARYVIAQEAYVIYTNALNKWLVSCNVGAMDIIKDLENLRDKTFKQCRQLASDLGLSIGPRCRIVAPKVEEKKMITEEEKMFGEAL